MKSFFVDVLIIGSGLGSNYSCFTTPGEEPSPTSGSFSFSTLRDRLVVGFCGGIVPAIKTNRLETAYREILEENVYMK
jgi:hypothetical protein